MASLLSSTDTTTYTGIFANHFDTFKRIIRVHKEPKKTFTLTPAPTVYPGYGGSSTESHVTLTPVYEDFDAIVSYGRIEEQQEFTETRTLIEQDRVKIKVENTARNYINQGKTENIEIDGNLFNVVSSESIQHFLGLKYYYFQLEKTK